LVNLGIIITVNEHIFLALLAIFLGRTPKVTFHAMHSYRRIFGIKEIPIFTIWTIVVIPK
jgi:hypothetical protein